MEWNDEAIVLSMRRHGESAAIVHLLTRDHGRTAGLVRGASGRELRVFYSPETRWRLGGRRGWPIIWAICAASCGPPTPPRSWATAGAWHAWLRPARLPTSLCPNENPILVSTRPWGSASDPGQAGLGGALRLLGATSAGRARLWTRPCKMRGDRLAVRSDLCIPALGARGFGCCRRTLSRPPARLARFPTHGRNGVRRRDFQCPRAHRLFSRTPRFRSPERPDARRSPAIG